MGSRSGVLGCTLLSAYLSLSLLLRPLLTPHPPPPPVLQQAGGHVKPFLGDLDVVPYMWAEMIHLTHLREALGLLRPLFFTLGRWKYLSSKFNQPGAKSI